VLDAEVCPDRSPSNIFGVMVFIVEKSNFWQVKALIWLKCIFLKF
jgi:hypothetical protein